MSSEHLLTRAAHARTAHQHMDVKRAVRWLGIKPHEWSVLNAREQSEAVECAKKALRVEP